MQTGLELNVQYAKRDKNQYVHCALGGKKTHTLSKFKHWK